MTEIIPAIMPKNFNELEAHAEKFVGLVESVQIDVMDGVFVPEKSWPYDNAGTLDAVFKEIIAKDRRLPEIDTLSYELDLMVDSPEKSVKSWTQTGAKRVIFHIESIKDQDWFWKQLAHIKSPAPEFGVSGVDRSCNKHRNFKRRTLSTY